MSDRTVSHAAFVITAKRTLCLNLFFACVLDGGTVKIVFYPFKFSMHFCWISRLQLFTQAFRWHFKGLLKRIEIMTALVAQIISEEIIGVKPIFASMERTLQNMTRGFTMTCLQSFYQCLFFDNHTRINSTVLLQQISRNKCRAESGISLVIQTTDCNCPAKVDAVLHQGFNKCICTGDHSA